MGGQAETDPQAGPGSRAVPPRKSRAYGQQWQRKRRADPAKRAKEQAAQRAQKAAWKRLARAHATEYLTILNEERFKEGLDSAHTQQSRARTKRMVAAEGIIDPEKQKRCAHNMGLKRFSWGKVCDPDAGGCGKRIT